MPPPNRHSERSEESLLRSNNQNAQWSLAFKRLRRRFFALIFCYANVPSSAQNDGRVSFKF